MNKGLKFTFCFALFFINVDFAITFAAVRFFDSKSVIS